MQRGLNGTVSVKETEEDDSLRNHMNMVCRPKNKSVRGM